MCTSRGCVRRSRAIPSPRNTSSPSTASATSSPDSGSAGGRILYPTPARRRRRGRIRYPTPLSGLCSCTAASAIRAIPRQMESRMQILITLGVMAVAVLQTSSFGTALKQSQPLLVKSVVNGDTIDVATVGRVRLLGIDAPAAGRGAATSAPLGREALDRLTPLVLNRWVRLEREGVAGVSTRR